MTSQLKVARQVRSTLRAQVTRDSNSVDESFSAITVENRENAVVLSQKLLQTRTKLSEKDVLIQESLSDDELNADVEKSIEYDDLITMTVEKLKSRIVDFKDQQSPKASAPQPNPSISTQNDVSNFNKLPKLKLMDFDGDPIHWEEFWDDFSSTVDSRKDISVIDKFKHLKGALKGEALRVVDGYLLTSANYTQVKDDLTERYGDPEIAIFAHLEALLAIAPASHSLEQLSKVRDACEMHIRSLVALGLSESTFGLVFTPILLSKLPLYVKMELHRKNGSNKWTLSQLRQLLKDEIKARDKSERAFMGAKSESKPDSKKMREKGPNCGPISGTKAQSSTSTLITGGASKKGGQKRDPKCSFCDENHYSAECEKFKTAESRVKQMSEKKQCFSCLSTRHRKLDCPKKNRKCYYCKREGHHSSICFSQFGKPSTEKKDVNCLSFSTLNPDAPTFQPHSTTIVATDENDSEQRSSVSSQVSKSGIPIMETLIAEVSGSKPAQEARLVFDTASTRSFIKRDLILRIGAKYLGTEYTSMGRFREDKRVTCKYDVFEVQLKLKDGSKKSLRLSAVDAVSPPVNLHPLKNMDGYEILQKLELAEQLVVEEREVQLDILVGLDYYYDLVKDDQIRFPNGVVVLSTALGYMATGFLADRGASRKDTTMFISASTLEHGPSFEWEKYWALEQIGIKEDPGWSDDDIAVAHFNKSVLFKNNRYHVKWPYKENIPELPDNYALAYGRLRSLMKRIKPVKDVLADYITIIETQEKKGVIEKAPDVPEGKVHYVPHHCVLTPWKATTKVRVVYDASAKASKTALSLNECLHRGPVMMADLCGLLLRFRLPKIAIISDIEKAYHQILLQKEDRDVTRFLWLKDTEKPVTADNVQEYRFVGVPFGFVSSPFLLAACISKHVETVKDEIGINMASDVYIDNILGGRNCVSDAIDYYNDAKKLFDKASMNLREWFSNDSRFLNAVADKDKGEGVAATVLGLKWDTQQDCLISPPGRKVTPDAKTKRSILSSLASSFDPCGWFCPVTIQSKMLMQEIWKQKYGWDEVLPESMVEAWKNVQENIEKICEIPVQRYLQNGVTESTTEKHLHCFVDASAKGYAAAVYLRVQSSEKVGCYLLFAKARIAPLKQMSIPRLELVAALTGARLIRFVEQELQSHISISAKYLWSDSKCVLAWIKRKTLSTPFVENRVREIRSKGDINFRYVRSQDNPADLPTRGMSFDALKTAGIWWNGPQWLINPIHMWPETSPESETEQNFQSELSVSMIVHSNPIDAIFDVSRFSKIDKLYRVSVYVYRFVLGSKWFPFPWGSIKAYEMVKVKQFWDRRVQQRHFPEIMRTGGLPNTKEYVQLGLFVDPDGLLRCRGRLYQSSLQENGKCPILLPKDDRYAQLVIEKAHRDVMHGGTTQTLAQLRREYWIIRGRSTVRNILSKCLLCRKYKGGPFKIPQPPQLPNFRVTMQRPFATVGIDYLGPLLIHDRGETVKIWVCLFTCAVIRAVHLEVVSSLSTQDFLLCMRRFVALYGRPKLIVSDNATQFKAADHTFDALWQEVLEDSSVQEFAAAQGIAWKFIPESAAWMGGFYERLVAGAKMGLKFALQRRLVSLVEVQTAVAEISAVMNSRPLTYDSDDPSLPVITPAHFMRGSSELFPNVSDNDNDAFGMKTRLQDTLLLNWKQIQAIVNTYWSRWHHEYLARLREYQWSTRQRNTSNLPVQVGAVVLIGDSLPRGVWKLARVKTLNLSKDGECRSVELITSNGKNLVRPIKLLYPLECSSQESIPSLVSHPKKKGNVQEVQVRRQPSKRIAAIKARNSIEETLAEEALCDQ